MPEDGQVARSSGRLARYSSKRTRRTSSPRFVLSRRQTWLHPRHSVRSSSVADRQADPFALPRTRSQRARLDAPAEQSADRDELHSGWHRRAMSARSSPILLSRPRSGAVRCAARPHQNSRPAPSVPSLPPLSCSASLRCDDASHPPFYFPYCHPTVRDPCTRVWRRDRHRWSWPVCWGRVRRDYFRPSRSSNREPVTPSQALAASAGLTRMASITGP